MSLKPEEKRVFCFFSIQVWATFSKEKKGWRERTGSFLLKALFPFVVLPRQCCRENAESALSDASPSKKTFVAKYLPNFSFTAFTACGKGGGGAGSMGIKDFQSRDFLRILGPKTTLWRQPHPPQFVSRAPTKCLFITNINHTTLFCYQAQIALSLSQTVIVIDIFEKKQLFQI